MLVDERLQEGFMNTLHSPRKEHSKTEFGKKNSEENFGESETFSISAAKLNENRMMYNVSDATQAQIKGYYLTQIKDQTLDILWVFSSVEIFYHCNFLDTVHGGNPAT